MQPPTELQQQEKLDRFLAVLGPLGFRKGPGPHLIWHQDMGRDIDISAIELEHVIRKVYLRGKEHGKEDLQSQLRHLLNIE